MLVLVVCLRWNYILTLLQRDALPMVLISAEFCGKDRRDDVRKGNVGFLIPSCHCLVQESISGAWVPFPRGGASAEPVGQCCAQS